MCAECPLVHCPRQPYSRQQMVEGDWVAQGNMEKNRGKGDGSMQPDMGHHHQAGCRPTVVMLSCGSLMCRIEQGEDCAGTNTT